VTPSAGDAGSAPPRPLTGIVVVDCARMVSGPLAAHFLAALGAEVIRIEPPGGDATWNTPPFVGPDGVHPGPRGPLDLPLGPLRRARGKRSVVCDLRDPRGRDLLLRLLAGADVLVENFRPGVMDGLGLDRTRLEAANPRLIHCAVTGFGPTGPYRDRPAMDLVVQAMSGLMAKTGFPDGPPVRSGAMVGDEIASAFAALAVLGALRQRDQDGRGRVVDVRMYEALCNLVWDEPVDHYEDAGLPERAGNLDPRAGPIGVFATSDGHVAVVLTDDAQWVRLCARMERSDLAAMTRSDRRGAGLAVANAAVATWCATRTTAECVAGFDACDLPAGPVLPPWAARHDPHAAATGVLEPLRHGATGAPTGHLGPRLPFRIDDVDLTTTPAEPLGASTDAVLRERGGCDDAELAALRAAGVIG
jgi:crotonobetainyl-CoA:carnitine CoA-transferase CaiB-like acyl-CoA transferase